ncbi:MAG TPA: mannonate dehydratase [Thermomicrobiales bacterium]|nr:mannonate dehydratase [Thermomicrobiales bacterium]
MFFQLAEYLAPFPDATWALARQAGVTHAVAPLPPESADGAPWDFLPLLRMKERFAAHGLELAVIETGFPWLHRAKLGLPGGEEEIARCQTLIRNLGAVGVPVVCWNFMAVFNWTRTSTTVPSRGGAWVTGYDHRLMANAPLTDAGPVSEEQLWESLRRVMAAIVPAAEAAGVKLALHPDDPPISPIRGVGRILTSPEAMRRAIALAPSPNNGITFCQGTFSTMGADVPAEIRRFGGDGQVHFVHFRDVRGAPDNFVETFHDDGQTDMLAALRAWAEVGFAGPLRPDHVPTMAGEDNLAPGYQTLGRLFALGYITGLAEAVENEA